FSQHLQQYYFF
ncbi:hypothetical protein CP09DC80_1029B, partial [Chlamydia psittaci 09DC80]